MMNINLIVIDDDDVNDIVGNLKNDNLKHKLVTPSSFASDIGQITDEYDLILMDQKLSGNVGKIPYMGTTLIQELRTRMADGEMPSKPIILWSIADSITSYSKEKSSHNLVDAVWKKEWLASNGSEFLEGCSSQLQALVTGYQKINDFIANANNVSQIFGLSPEQYSALVPEPVQGYLENDNHYVGHTLSQFLINSVLRFSGFLIDEETLAARLGISIDSVEWEKFKTNELDKFRYKGIYSDYYNRWWTTEIENWWFESVSSDHPAGLTAEERILALSKIYDYNFNKAELGKGHTSESFWQVCVISRVPIDPIDSFKLTSSERREWQDQVYACYETIIKKDHKKFGFEMFPRDKERFLKLKEKLKNESK